LLPTFTQATSWYANVGSWEIERQSETLSFELQEYCSGDITGVKATPQGRMVRGGLSKYTDVDLDDVAAKQRRSALQGEIKSEKYAKLSAEAEEPVTREILKPSGYPFYRFNFTEIWPVHLQSNEAVVYRGLEINDRDLSINNLDRISSSFLYASELSAIKHCRMEISHLNITVIADNGSVIDVEFLPTKQMSFGIEAFSSGMAELSYQETAPDMVTTINEGYQRFLGDYSLNATIEMGASNMKRLADFQEGYGCCPGCRVWEEDQGLGTL